MNDTEIQIINAYLSHSLPIVRSTIGVDVERLGDALLDLRSCGLLDEPYYRHLMDTCTELVAKYGAICAAMTELCNHLNPDNLATIDEEWPEEIA